MNQNIYFVGIGGIGMSALARFFHHEGFRVAGYDRTRTPLTEKLEAEGIAVHYTDDLTLVGSEFKDPAATRVIYTPAIPKEHSELCYFQNNDFRVIKRSKALGLLCEAKYTMAVAGTHGKSTTSTLVAWINSVASTDGAGSAFLGAISKNFGTNMVMGAGDRMAVEADEFDRSFHQLYPAVALITSCDPDHLDIYGTAENFHDGFLQFVSQVKECTVVKHGLDLPHTYTYSLDNPYSDYYAQNIHLKSNGFYEFDLNLRGEIIEKCTLGIPGLINVENAVGAVALVAQRGFDRSKIREALGSYSGIERRFDLWINREDRVYLDDYAHHPEELRNMLTSVRNMFPKRHITICFQPHLYTRTRDFASGFSEALSLADRVVLIPIYPAREEPIAGVTSKIIYDNITSEKIIVEKVDMVETLRTLATDVVITAGAGDIDMLRHAVAKMVEQR